MTLARNSSPGLVLSLIAVRFGLTARLVGTLVGAEFVLPLCFRRTGSDSLLVKLGRAGMLVDVTRLHARNLLVGAVWWPRTLDSRQVPWKPEMRINTYSGRRV